jgi:hypothetical protein
VQKETKEERTRREHLDVQLDRELEDTFPASDPTKITLSRAKKRDVPAPSDEDQSRARHKTK